MCIILCAAAMVIDCFKVRSETRSYNACTRKSHSFIEEVSEKKISKPKKRQTNSKKRKI